MPPVDENYSLGLIERQVEALLFVSPQPVAAETIAAHLGISAERAEAAIKTLRAQYAKGRGITLLHLGGGWQMATAPDLADTVESFAAFSRPSFRRSASGCRARRSKRFPSSPTISR